MSLRASLAYITVRAVSGVLSVCSLSLFVRGLGAEEYANFALGLAAAALVSTVLMIPLNTTLARLYGDSTLRARVQASLLAAVLGFGGGLLVAALVAEWLGASWLAPWVLPAAALFAATQGVLDFSVQRANSALETRRYGYLLLVKAVAVIGLGVATIHLFNGAPALLLAMSMACMISVAGSMRGRFSLRGCDASLAPRIAGFAAPLMVTCFLSYLLNWGDRYLLMHFVPMAELGRYSALADLTQQTLVLVCSGLGAAWYPRIVQAWGAGQREEAQRLFSRYAVIAVSLVMPAAIGFSFLLSPAAALLFGQGFADLPPNLPTLLVLAAVVGGCKSFYFDVPLLLAERTWQLAGGIALSAAMSLVLMSWALPRHGISGAAMGLLCGQTLGLLYSFLMGRAVLHHRLGSRQLFTVLVASAVMGCGLWAWQPGGFAGLLLRFLTAVLIYALVLLVLDFDGARARIAGALRRTP
ncbi:lipopolysaccharide biosynthesis protein [Uliginosibacterium sp. H3]|uniref:Lipopolysaccharide biosynthesis protein n=1 Tax=Uliginosibacterium silvisoli TaxID=3114758 RepID=A0ABU6K7J4_9RHOO|nr:lipopolysaccharide biosynthesis protein [Uliginosibacterium sp. H3]